MKELKNYVNQKFKIIMTSREKIIGSGLVISYL
jgi:hypothetical protein